MEHILSLSYGKDSIACLEACRLLKYPIDRVVHAEIWATDTVSADLPLMMEFKKKADKIIKERYGFTVEHISAQRGNEKLTFDKQFYSVHTHGKNIGKICGFPTRSVPWCNGTLKVKPLTKFLNTLLTQEANTGIIQYLGIAADEHTRIERHRDRSGIVLPLVDIGWDEGYCRQWCKENDLLSPIYSTSTRGGVGSVTINQ